VYTKKIENGFPQVFLRTPVFCTLKPAFSLSFTFTDGFFSVEAINAGLTPSKYAIYVPIREMVLDYNIQAGIRQQLSSLYFFTLKKLII
jgi:hypothetical protein